MRKNLLLVFIVSFCSSFGQEGIFQFSKNYYRSDPFTGRFSDFLDHLLNDPSAATGTITSA